MGGAADVDADIGVRPYGRDGLLLELGDADLAARVAVELRDRRDADSTRWPYLDVIGGAATVGLFASRPIDADLRGRTLAIAREVAGRPSDADAGVDEVVLDVSYDGEDLAEVADLLRMTTEEVVEAHTSAEWRVAFCGFAPGFAYLSCNDDRLVVPRRDSARTRVPAGAVGLAGAFSGVYPRASPGGWQLIGTTSARLWDTDRDPPALLSPGTRVRFARADATRPPVREQQRSAPTSDHDGDRALIVEATGPFATVQDLGRPGWAHLGVGRSGAADRTAAQQANVLVGNPTTAPLLEVTAGGLTLTATDTCLVTVTGAAPAIAAAGRTYGPGELITVGPGDRVQLSTPTAGLRSYLAVRGGLDVPAELGSAATDTLGGLGPRPLRTGDRLPVAHLAEPDLQPLPDVVGLGAAYGRYGPHDEQSPFRLDPGPRADWCVDALGTLTAAGWQVSADSDRVGVRLAGGRLRRAESAEGELPSEAVRPGAVQIPPSGEPVLFGADAPVTGGYPVVAVVAAEDLDRLAQLRPGDPVRFRAG